MGQFTQSGIFFDFQTDQRYSPVYGKPLNRLVQFFPSSGCVPWLRTKGDCCLFCNIPYAVREAAIGQGYEDNFSGWHIPVVDSQEMFDTSFNSSSNIHTLALFNGGSFLTDAEVPAAFRQYAYQHFAQHSTARQMMVESRSEFITETMLDEAIDRINGKDFMVGIGLESRDEFVRNTVLKKYVGLPTFERAVSLMQRKGVQIFVYTFLKAPSLSEREAFEDSIKTISYLTELGIDEIALSCAFVPKSGYLEQLYNNGEFRPPWLWTILEIMELAKAKGWPLSVGGFDDHPPPVAIASNCPKCDKEVLAAIDRFRIDGVMPNDLPDCACRDEWRREMR